MSKAKRCPNCRLVSPGSAQVCDCGYNFTTGGMDDPPEGRDLPSAKSGGGGRQLLAGMVLLAVGIGITVVTHDSAERSGGGTYIVAYGPIVAGAFAIIRGLARGL